MGRTILCPYCKSTFDEDILKQKNSMDVCLVCGESLLGNGDADKADEEEHPDWITWWYYKDPMYGDFSLWDKPPLHPEELELIKKFKAPPESKYGLDEVKRILRTYVPDAFEEPKEVPKMRCPYCSSTEIQIVPKKYSLLTGFATNGCNRVCVRCKRKF